MHQRNMFSGAVTHLQRVWGAEWTAGLIFVNGTNLQIILHAANEARTYIVEYNLLLYINCSLDERLFVMYAICWPTLRFTTATVFIVVSAYRQTSGLPQPKTFHPLIPPPIRIPQAHINAHMDGTLHVCSFHTYNNDYTHAR